MAGHDQATRSPTLFAFFAIDLPAMLERLGEFFADQVWPIFLEVLTQPLLWLAVAALVFGSRVLSLAELWRKGQPYAARVPGASVFARYAEKRALRRIGPPPRGVRLAAARPGRPSSATSTTSTCRPSTRCGWCSGPASLFLGSYILAYALVLIAQNYFETLLTLARRRPGLIFWVRWEPVFDAADRRAVRDAAAVPARGGVPALPGAVLTSASDTRPRLSRTPTPVPVGAA